MTNKKKYHRQAILDFVGFPQIAPGVLECRMAKSLFTEHGALVDQGTRGTSKQTNCHRFPLRLAADVSLLEQLAEAREGVERLGYGWSVPPVLGTIIRHEGSSSVLQARHERLQSLEPEARVVVRALGFDLLGQGQLAVGLGLVNAFGDQIVMTKKASVLLHAGDSLPALFEALEALADRIYHNGLCPEDVSLVEAAAECLWTPAAVATRNETWQKWACANEGVDLSQARQLEFTERVSNPVFHDYAASPEPRLQEGQAQWLRNPQ